MANAIGRSTRKEAMGPFPSQAVQKRLRSIPEEVEEVLTLSLWAKRPRVPGLDADYHRVFCNRVIAFYRTNEGTPKIAPGKIRKAFLRKAAKLRRWAADLSELNEIPRYLEARAGNCGGETVGEKIKNARAQTESLRAELSQFASGLESASFALPPETRKMKQKSEVLCHLIYILNFHLRRHTGIGARSTSARHDTMQFTVWLFRIADPKLTAGNITTAAKKSLRKGMSDDDYLEQMEVLESSASLVDPSFEPS